MESKEYFYLNGETRVGPISLDVLMKTPISPTTLVWNNSLPDWVEARTLPELAGIFVTTPTPPPTPPPPPATNYNAENAMGSRTDNVETKPPMPDNYLVFAIISTIFCCWPLGIVSIINSVKVGSAYAEGDYEGAKEASVKAKKWATWTAIAGVVSYVIFIIFYAILGVAALGLGSFE